MRFYALIADRPWCSVEAGTAAEAAERIEQFALEQIMVGRDAIGTPLLAWMQGGRRVEREGERD